MKASAESIIDVAVGVVTLPDGRVLLAERPAGKPAAGYWEFPGGKLEPDENPAQALTRELHEELGVEIEAAHPWITRLHRYPHMTVRLHIYRVRRWHGEPQGREGQRLVWKHPRTHSVEPLLPANHSILAALALPPVYAITQASKYGAPDFMQRLQRALDSGMRLIQVREPDMPADARAEFARQVVELAHAYQAQVLINGDERLAASCGADGVHLQARQLMSRNSPPATAVWSASCHDRAELLRAAELGASFVVLSPVLATASHPDATPLGWEHFETLCADLPMPVFALGGMQIAMLETAINRHAHGIALLSGVWQELPG